MSVRDWTVLKGQENANELNKQLNYKKLLNPIQQKMFEKIIHIGKNFIYTFKLWVSKILKCCLSDRLSFCQKRFERWIHGQRSVCIQNFGPWIHAPIGIVSFILVN